MQQFFANNWLSMLSILIGIIVAYVFYRLQKKDSTSASAERKKHATTELLDVIESYIINKQRISEQVIDNLIHASERHHIVALRPGCSAVSLLQDVALRLQRSRHLDIPQKSEYSEKIEQLIREIREHREPLRLENLDEVLSTQLLKLQDFLPPEKKADAQQVLSAVASLVQKQRGVTIRVEETKERMVALTTVLLGVTASIATALTGSKVFETVNNSAVKSIVEKIFPILGITLALTVGMLAIATTLRIKRRSRSADKRDSTSDD